MPIYKSKKKDNCWKIENVEGCSPTKSAAKKRLRAIKSNQSKRKKKK